MLYFVKHNKRVLAALEDGLDDKSCVCNRFYVVFVAAGWRPVQADLLTMPDMNAEVAELLLQAEKVAREDRVLETFALVQQALAKARELNDKSGEAVALFALSVGFKKMGLESKADDLGKKSRAILRENGDSKIEVSVLNSVGSVYRWGGLPQKALAMYDEALVRAQEIKYDKGAADALHNIGEVYRTMGTGKPMEYYQHAVEIRRRIDDKKGQAESLNSMGIVTPGLEGMNFLLQALTLRRESRDLVGEAETTFRLEVRYRDGGQAKQYVKYLNESLKLLCRARQERENARVESAKKTGKAVAPNLNDLALEHNEKRKEASTLMMLGYRYLDTRQSDDARNYFEQALRINEEIGNKRGQAAALEAIGHVLANSRKHSESIQYFEKALSIHRETGYQYGIAMVTRVIGDQYFYLGNFAEAEKYLSEALTLNKETSADSWLFHNLALLKEKQGHLDEATKHLGKLVAFMEESRNQWGPVRHQDGGSRKQPVGLSSLYRLSAAGKEAGGSIRLGGKDQSPWVNRFGV